MKRRFLWIAIASLLACPLFAQDDAGFDDGGGLFLDDSGGFFGGADAGRRGNQEADRLSDVRRWLTQASAPPLARDQERLLTTLIDSEVKAMTEAFVARFGHPPGAGAPVARGEGQQAGAPRGNGGVEGQRGAGQGRGTARGGQQARGGVGGGFNRLPPEEAAEMRRMNEELTAKVIGALKTDQQTSLRKWQSEQIRTRRVDTLKRDMTAAGVALTPEQIPQIEALYLEESEARTKMLLESPGPVDPAKVNQLETQTVLKAVRLLTAEQRKALTDSMAKARGQQR
jgi:hypothetical protein